MGAMLREGLRAELPGLVGLPARIRLPTVPLASPWLAAVSALGVSALVSAIIGTAASASFYLFGPDAIQLRSPAPTTILADALATAFAFGAASWGGVLATAALIHSPLDRAALARTTLQPLSPWIEAFAQAAVTEEVRSRARRAR